MDASLQQLFAPQQQQLLPEDKAAVAGHHDHRPMSNPFLEEAEPESVATPTPTAGAASGGLHQMKFDCPFLAQAARAGDSTTQHDDVVMRIDSTEQRTTDDFLEMNDICSKAGGHNQDEDHQLLKAGDKQLSSTTACSTGDECCEEFVTMSGDKEKNLSSYTTTSTSEFLEAAIGDYINTAEKQGPVPDQHKLDSSADVAGNNNDGGRQGKEEAKDDNTTGNKTNTVEGPGETETTPGTSARTISPTGARLYVDTVEQGQTQWDARIEAAHLWNEKTVLV